MAKAVFLFPLLLLLISENLLLAKDTSLKQSNKSNPNKKLLHGEKHKAILSNKAHLKQNRNHLQTCEIICPFVLPPPENCNSGPNRPEAPNVKPTTTRPTTTTSTTEEPSTESEESTEEEADSPPNNSTGSSKNITGRFHKPMKRGHTQTFRIVATRELKKTLGHGDRKTTYNQLSRRQKHILLKQLSLGNRHGKKGLKFRQINPYQCQVVCHVEYEQEYPSFAQPITSYQEGGDSDDDDSYEEGEDTPIQITYNPINPQGVVAGVRPIGNVDFMGLDDFGPTGELAADPSVIFEEKKGKKKTEKANPRKKAAVKEKRN